MLPLLALAKVVPAAIKERAKGALVSFRKKILLDITKNGY
jgi:hypothetical protein